MDDPVRVAFVEVCAVEPGRFRAAALVTDGYGDPLEFRCTSPIRPTRFQQILWGRRLSGHLFVHVLGKPLLAALSAPPDVIAVRNQALLGLRAAVGVPAVQLLATADGPACRSLTDRPAPAPGLVEPGPVFARPADAHPADFDAAAARLARLTGAVHPLEPFARILQAVKAVHEEETVVKAV